MNQRANQTPPDATWDHSTHPDFYDYPEPLGFRCLDRFDLVDVEGKGKMAQRIIALVKWSPSLRLLAHVATPGTTLVGIRP